ncbi:MAG TPA: molybdenum cofactor guanylyltransferase [Candidatus Dormibacteraeota bacterium]|nr:molybdenum cofactor guanylyltransferase [Candidatus Dormibacteraeota bacterium]
MMLGLLILAGGHSSRMGRDKAGLPFPNPDDPPLIRRVADGVSGVAGPPTIVGPVDYGTGWRLVSDEPGLSGPVAGLIAGLAASTSDLVLVLAADLPFPSPRLARELAKLASREPESQAIVPERAGELEPLFAVYRRDALADLREMARQLGRPGHGPSLYQTVRAVRLRTVSESEWHAWDPEGDSFLNCNTPDELAAAVARARVRPNQGGYR